jgi:hypothetical protein
MPDLGGLDAELWLLYPLLRISRLSSVSSFSHDKRWRRDFIGATERQNNDPRWRNLFLSISYEPLLSPGISARPCHEMLGEPHTATYLPSLRLRPCRVASSESDLERKKREILNIVCALAWFPTIYTTPHSFLKKKKKRSFFFFNPSSVFFFCKLEKENCNIVCIYYI